MRFVTGKVCNSQRQVLGFLSHDADAALFGEDRRVLLTDALVEQHISIPVASPHIWIRVSYRKTGHEIFSKGFTNDTVYIHGYLVR